MLDELLRGWKDQLLSNRFVLPLFLKLSPNILTLIAFQFGLICCFCCLYGKSSLALIFWGLNRIFDGLDGTVARFTNGQTDFGGYIDIICDFVIYAMVPVSIGFYINEIDFWIAVALFESVCFVNTASLFMLAGIMEKRKTQQKLTTIVMPSALIEGTETVVFFVYLIAFPAAVVIHLFSVMVSFNIFQRLFWAWKNL
jgi:phosphatidylserine synthase